MWTLNDVYVFYPWTCEICFSSCVKLSYSVPFDNATSSPDSAFQNDENRQLSTVFMELPSPKQYPDYYEIIDTPIDLARIETKIRGDQYDSEIEILQDFKVGGGPGNVATCGVYF